MKKLILLGKISKLSGFGGAVVLKLSPGIDADKDLPDPVFLEIEGRPVPFFIDRAESARPGTFLVRFKDYDTYEKASELAGCRVFCHSGEISASQGPDEYDLLGFRFISDDMKIKGRVEEVVKNPSQWLLNIRTTGNENILIPLHEDLVRDIDPDNKVIRMIVPDGLAGINR